MQSSCGLGKQYLKVIPRILDYSMGYTMVALTNRKCRKQRQFGGAKDVFTSSHTERESSLWGFHSGNFVKKFQNKIKAT
jgi:hypothetical protein